MILTQLLVGRLLYGQEILHSGLVVILEFIGQQGVGNHALVDESDGKAGFGFSHLFGSNLWRLRNE